MTEQDIKSLYARLHAGDVSEDLDIDRLARLAAGEVHADSADVELLAGNPTAATAYRIARGLRADAHALSAATQPVQRVSHGSVRQSRRRLWPLALAASAGLVAVLIAAGVGFAPEQATTRPVASPAEPAPLFSGSFEPSVASAREDGRGDGRGVIFDASFDNG